MYCIWGDWKFITVTDKRSGILDPIAFHLTLTVSFVETKRRIGIMDTSRGLHMSRRTYLNTDV